MPRFDPAQRHHWRDDARGLAEHSLGAVIALGALAEGQLVFARLLIGAPAR